MLINKFIVRFFYIQISKVLTRATRKTFVITC